MQKFVQAAFRFSICGCLPSRVQTLGDGIELIDQTRCSIQYDFRSFALSVAGFLRHGLMLLFPFRATSSAGCNL